MVCMFSGFSARKATSVLVQYETGRILHMEVADSKEAGGSNKLESMLAERLLRSAAAFQYTIKEVVTDASKSIISLFRK